MKVLVNHGWRLNFSILTKKNKFITIINKQRRSVNCAKINEGKHTPCFYELFPDLEIDAKVFVEEQVKKKDCSFSAHTLFNFMNEHYKELTGDECDMVRSERLLIYDLKRWGFKNKSNTKRPYFEGDERDDVVPERNKFVDYFLGRNFSLFLYYQRKENFKFLLF
jgi:hypothetical protein